MGRQSALRWAFGGLQSAAVGLQWAPLPSVGRGYISYIIYHVLHIIDHILHIIDHLLYVFLFFFGHTSSKPKPLVSHPDWGAHLGKKKKLGGPSRKKKGDWGAHLGKKREMGGAGGETPSRKKKYHETHLAFFREMAPSR